MNTGSVMTVNLIDETGKLRKTLCDILQNTAKEAVLAECIKRPCSVDILIVDLHNIREINRDSRGIDAPTDVLSFPSGELEHELSRSLIDNLFLGDIVIAFEKIFSQAQEYGHSPERETGFLTAHAMLHLMGYDHGTKEEESIMFAKQELILNKMELMR